MQDDILELAVEVSRVTGEKIGRIETIMRQTRLLALNARIEAGRAGPAGAAFGVVAQEMTTVSGEITEVADELRRAVQENISRIERVGSDLVTRFRGARFADLALNAIEIIDRNLYERSCDVRWWATDSAVVAALETGSPAAARHAVDRLATILRSYTVYLDLWILDTTGRVIATGRPGRYPDAASADLAKADWFRQALATASGDDFVVADVARNPALDGVEVATYATAIRAGGEVDGRPLGVLGIFFDWGPQAQAVLDGVALSDEERRCCRALLLNRRGEVLARSGAEVGFGAACALDTAQGPRGFYRQADRLVGYALTPGYETYRGLGWYGVIEQRLDGGDPS